MSKFLKGVELLENGVEQQGYFIPCLTGKGAPTEAQEGAIGSLYLDEDSGNIYKCIAIDDNGCQWVKETKNTASEVGALPDTVVPITKGGTGATTETIARKNLHVLFSTPLIASSNHTGFVINGDSTQDRKILVKVKMAHQNGHTCEAMFPISTMTGAPVASVCQHSGTLGFTSFQYKTDGNTTSYSIKYNVSGIYAFGSLELLTFINTKSGHDGEIALKLDAYMSFDEVTDGTPMEIEWANPPMSLGVEYRTTERWQGKAVYVYAISFGTLPNNTYKQVHHNISMTNVVRYSAFTDNDIIPFVFQNYEASIDVSKKSIAITTNYDATARSATVIIWYTKD